MRSAVVLILLTLLSACSRQPDAAVNQHSIQSEPAPKLTRFILRGAGTVTSPDLPVEDKVLDAEQVKRLRVEWGEPKRINEEAAWRWGSPSVEITGKLFMLQEDGQTRQLVDWPLPLLVLLGSHPGSVVSQWRSDEDYIHAGVVVGFEFFRRAKTPQLPKGVFIAQLQLANLHTEPGKIHTFQVGLCLGKKKGTSVSWDEDSPILPQSLAMVKVRGPKPINTAMQLINGCPAPYDRPYSPLTVIRTVNHLQSLGKEKAIASCREFNRIAYYPGHSRQRIDPANIDTSNQIILQTLIPLLFPNLEKYWCITVEQGIPFNTFVSIGSSGQPPWIHLLVDEGEKEGKFRELPLRPTDNPLEAADALFAKFGKQVQEGVYSEERGLRCNLRKQAWDMIHHLVSLTDPRMHEDDYFDDDEHWHQLKAKVAALKIRWDEQKQEYVAGVKP